MNYNDLQRMQPYYNTMNFRYNDNIPKALPIIRNNRFDHSNITVAPPIPSYYKQNINSSNYYSHLPNIMGVTYSSAEKIAKNFSNNLNNLRNIEEQIAEGNRVYNLPKLNQTQNDINYQNMLKSKKNEKIENGGNVEDMKEKLDQMRQEAGRIPDYKTEEQKRILKNKELMSEAGINAFNKNLITTLGDYSNNIQKAIESKNTNEDAMYEMIRQGITSLKEDFSKRIERFNNLSKQNMEKMRKIMQSSTSPRLKLLSENLFSTSDIDQMLRLREKNRRKNGNLVDNRRMSELMLQAQDLAKLANEQNKQEELNKDKKEEEENKDKNIVVKTGEEVEKIPLDLWEKKRAKAIKADLSIDKRVNIFSKNYFELQPLNRFRGYVFSVMAARRILNIKYMVFKEFKFTSVSYYISNYEDMDIILKKLVYNTVKEPLLEILNNTEMNINLTYDTEDNHETYFLLQDYIQRIINNFNSRFFSGVSGEMMKYLSLYITNYSFIPKDFFTTFELVRIRTSETGEFIELNNENRKMILTFYIFIKILLRNIFLELMFNQADRKKLSLNPKLNIKMLVSVLYRSIIKFLVKNCVTRTNLEDLENAEDMTAFLKVKYSKREFHLHRFLKKRYFLKVSEVDEQPKRISRRTRKVVSPKSSEGSSKERKIREMKKYVDLKNKKKIKKLEKQNKKSSDKSSSDKSSSDKSSSKKTSDKKSSEKKSSDKKSSNKKSDDKKSDDKKSGDKKSGDKKSGDKKSDEKKSSDKKKDEKKSSESESESDEEEEEESDSEDEKSSKDKKSGSKKSSKKDEDKEKKDDNNKSSNNTDNKKKKGRAPPPESESDDEEEEEDDEEEEEEEEDDDSEEESKKNKKAKGKKDKKSSSDNTKSDEAKKAKKAKKEKKSSSNEEEEEEEDDEEEEEEEDDDEEEKEEDKVTNDNYKEEREKLMPKRKVSTEKVNGKVKRRLMGEEPKLKIAIRGKNPLKGKDTIKDFSKSDIDNMYFIIENYQSYGDDLDSNEVDLLDRVLYTNKSLDKYYLYANEYAFDPGELIDKIMDKLLDKIQMNFSRLDDD